MSCCLMCTGISRGRCVALGIAALYHRQTSAHCEMRLTPTSAHCEVRPTPMQQAPRRGQRCLQMSAGPAPRPTEAHHYPVTKSAPGRRASPLQVVVTQTRRPSRNGGKLVAEAHQNHHDTMLAHCHGGLRGCSTHAAEARGSALGCSPRCLKLDRILCMTCSDLFWFLVCYAATQLATPLHQRRIQVVRSNKVARKRLTNRIALPQWTSDT